MDRDIRRQAEAEELDEADIMRRWLRIGRQHDPAKVAEVPAAKRP